MSPVRISTKPEYSFDEAFVQGLFSMREGTILGHATKHPLAMTQAPVPITIFRVCRKRDATPVAVDDSIACTTSRLLVTSFDGLSARAKPECGLVAMR
jgi:hypothetical protein